MELLEKIDILLNEKKWSDKVKNPGILELDDGEDVMDKKEEYFIKLAEEKGREAVVRALMNLYRWNKNDNKKLSVWAKNMQEKVTTHFGKSPRDRQ